MARSAGTGFTSLPPYPDYLQRKIELSLHSFDASVSAPGPERYLFVLEDSATGDIGGCCAIEAACGLDEPFYNYHVGTTVHASRELKVYNRISTLHLSNDYTGASVLCSLYLRPELRTAGVGRLLSKSRFLFMAAHRERFAEKVIAELRGVSDDDGRSPFWEGLGRHFFRIDYSEAEHVVGRGNKAFIAELMPPHPIYAVMLSAEAQSVIGQVHPRTVPALRLLAQEGFRYQNYVDIFDGGPTVEAPLLDIRSIRHARTLTCRISTTSPQSGPDTLLANMSLADFRCVMAACGDAAMSDTALLTPAIAQALEVSEGDPILRVLP